MFESKHWYHCSRFFDTDACVSSFSKGHSNVTFATGKQILLCLFGLCNPGAFPRNPALLPDPDEIPSRTKKKNPLCESCKQQLCVLVPYSCSKPKAVGLQTSSFARCVRNLPCLPAITCCPHWLSTLLAGDAFVVWVVAPILFRKIQ